MKLRWTRGRPGGVRGSWAWDHLMFWDLIDDEANPDWYPEGVNIGWVERERRDGEPDVFVPYPNHAAHDSLPTTTTLAQAKAALVAWAVAKELEELQ